MLFFSQFFEGLENKEEPFSLIPRTVDGSWGGRGVLWAGWTFEWLISPPASKAKGLFCPDFVSLLV